MIEAFYAKSPVAIQNVMVSAYGLVLYWRRIASRTHRKMLEELAAIECYDIGQVQALQKHLLHHILVHANRSVPHYRDLFKRLGVNPDRHDALEVLNSLPILEKSEIRSRPEQFLSESSPGDYTINTSGTTGSPLAIRCTRRALLRNYSHFYYLRQRLGVTHRDRCATFAGRVIVEPDRDKPPFWRHNLATNTILYSTYHLSPDNLPAYVDRLVRQQPALIDSYPSALGIIANAVRHRTNKIRPKAIITSAETLIPHQRAAAEEAFGCQVTDQYGNAEMTAFVVQCTAGMYHVWPSYGFCEVLVDGRPARPGESGDLVTTGFINETMPLIRYRTGDTAVMGDSCSCGLNFPTLERIEGRKDDILVTADGREVGRLDPVFKGLRDDAFLEVQIVQTGLNEVLIRYVPGSRYEESALVTVSTELRKRLGSTVRVTNERVAELPRGPNGKLKAVIGLRSSRDSTVPD